LDARALRGIAQERLCNGRSSVQANLSPFDVGALAFRLVRAFELMIPRGFTEQLLHVGRCIVDGSGVDPHDTLLAIMLITRTELQACDAVRVDADQVQAVRRDLHVDLTAPPR
jgi:hypothetical protein